LKKKTVRDLDIAGKRVLLRADFNVPFETATATITDDTRMRATLPTIEYLLARGARVVLCSHLGRPGGLRDSKLSLRPVARRLAEMLGKPVTLLEDCIGPVVKEAVGKLGRGQAALLENLRFHASEEKNDPAFSAELASLGEVFVNDAFGAAHRAHSSTEGVAHHLPAVAGFLMEKELRFLGAVLERPEHPFYLVLGGAKVGDKVGVIQNLLDRVDGVLVGGGIANTFLKAQGLPVGASLYEEDKVAFARTLLDQARARHIPFLMPVDVTIADRFDAAASSRVVPVAEVPTDWRIMDIGPKSSELFRQALADARLVLWNGPMGVYEFPRFAEGTRAVGHAISAVKGTTIVGGGETAAAVHALGLADRMSHVSTGGGATLEFLEGRTLPGIAALLDA